MYLTSINLYCKFQIEQIAVSCLGVMQKMLTVTSVQGVQASKQKQSQLSTLFSLQAKGIAIGIPIAFAYLPVGMHYHKLTM